MKVLGPWPVLQLLFGVGVLGFGVFMIIKGTQKRDDVLKLEDRYAERRAFEQLDEIHENSFKQVELLAKIYDRMNENAQQLKAMASILWNRGQERGPY